MKILFIVHQFMPEFSTGTERFTMNIAKMHQRNGHQADILTCSAGDAALWLDEIDGLRRAMVDGINVYGLPREFLGAMAELGGDPDESARQIFAAFLEAGGYDIVHVTHAMRMLAAIEAVIESAIPFVLTLTDFYSLCFRINLVRADGEACQGPDLSRACQRHCSTSMVTGPRLTERWQRFRAMLWAASEIVACSDFVARAFGNEFPGLPIRVQGHGIDLIRFSPRPRRDGDTIVFGYLGTLSKSKGVHVLAEAFTRAAPGNARLEMIGSVAGDDAFRTELKCLEAENLKIFDAIDHSAVPDTLARFDVFCLPSLVPETFSLALHEGFAAGLPCLVSDIGWPPELVRRTGCGRVAAAGDATDWSRAIREISEHRELLGSWKNELPLPLRVEEESFFYEQIYRRAIFAEELARLSADIPAG